MRVSILGVFVGAIVDVSSSFVLGLPLAVYVALKLPVEQRLGPHAGAAATAALHDNHAVYYSEVAIGLLCSALGGYVAAAIAKRHERLNGALSSWLCVALGIVTIGLHLQHDPLCQQALLLAASPLMASMGGALRQRQRMRQPAIGTPA